MDNSMLQALADYMKVKPPRPFRLQRQNGVTKYADYEFEEQVPEPPRKKITEKERVLLQKAREFGRAFAEHKLNLID